LLSGRKGRNNSSHNCYQEERAETAPVIIVIKNKGQEQLQSKLLSGRKGRNNSSHNCYQEERVETTPVIIVIRKKG